MVAIQVSAKKLKLGRSYFVFTECSDPSYAKFFESEKIYTKYEVNMSLFQCENCGAAENTALACQGFNGVPEKWFDWTGIEDRKGKMICSECGPVKYSDGTPTEYGKWHGQFDKTILPLGEFETNDQGNRHGVGLRNAIHTDARVNRGLENGVRVIDTEN